VWLAVGLAALASLVATASPTASTAPGRCSKATALVVAKQFFVWGNDVRTPVAQVLCGPFAGPGSEAMAVTFTAPTCWPVQGWAVYRRTGGEWGLVLAQPGVFLDPPLVAVGSEIQEARPVFRQGDNRCNPSGGSRSRLWRWNGSRLAAGPWKQGKPAAPGGRAAAGYFKTPSGNIVCFHSPGPKDMPEAFLVCGIKSGLNPPPPRRTCREGDPVSDRVVLPATGPVQVPPCAGDPGPFLGLQVGARVLAYGQAWSDGGIRCDSAITGLTCRNSSGRGFFLSRERWRSF
jgi:hypothetical protein